MNLTFQDALVNLSNATPPPKHMALPLEKIRSMEIDAKVNKVAQILEEQGHCPVKALAGFAKDNENTPGLKAAVNRWLMEHAYPKPKSVEITGEMAVTHKAVDLTDDELAAIAAGRSERTTR